ncbi:transcription initiation factor TFIID subunit 11-like [Convolutriloba macropyga]|uniref:transcription initiation factor TFIID subunit 11-like n=1 Tax=Convolutriloba macropyga TaxID=536237 RepID=UPI003F52317F
MERSDELSKLQLLVSHFSEEQLDRFEYYKRSGFSRGSMKKVITNVTGCQKVPPNVVIAVCGAAKVYMSELIEEALDVQDQLNKTGPLHPEEIREAERRINEKTNHNL